MPLAVGAGGTTSSQRPHSNAGAYGWELNEV